MAERAPAQVKPTIVPNLPTTSGTLQRKCACGTHTTSNQCDSCKGGAGLLQRKAAGRTEYSEVPPIVHEVLRSPGRPLDATTRAFFEPRFGRDFSHVRVHTDARAAESARLMNALAYTVGSELVFGDGQYAPQSGAGRQVLAHELTHVVQQQEGRGQSAARTRSSVVDDRGLEAEADQMAGGLSLGMTTTWPMKPMRQVTDSLHANTTFALQRQKNTGSASVSRPTLRARDFTVDHTFYEFVAHSLSYVGNLDGTYLYRAYRSDEADAPKSESKPTQTAPGGPQLVLPGVTPNVPADLEDKFVFMSNPPETPPPISMIGPPFYYHIVAMEDSDPLNNETGLMAHYLIPSRNTEPRIVVFRGTEPTRLDIQDDANKKGVGAGSFEGTDSFEGRRKKIVKTLDNLSKMRGNRTVLIGHSLGGALAQRAAAANPSKVDEVVTFNSPGIGKEAVSEFAEKSKDLADKPKITYYETKGDIVSTAGGARLPGTALMMEGIATKELRAMLNKGIIKVTGDTLVLLYRTMKSLAKTNSNTSQLVTLLSSLKAMTESGAILYLLKVREVMGMLHSQRLLRASQITPEELSPPKWPGYGPLPSQNWRPPAPDIKDLADKAGKVKTTAMDADEISVPLNSAALATLANLSLDKEIDVVFNEIKPLVELAMKEPVAALGVQFLTGGLIQVVAQKAEPLLYKLVLVINAAGGLETLIGNTFYDKPKPIFEKPNLSIAPTLSTTPRPK